MSSKCYAECGTLTDEDLAQTEVIVEKFNEQWRELFDSVPPKVHMWDHLLDDLKRTRGLLCHHEGFIERMHQDGVRLKRWFGGVRDALHRLESECQAMADKEGAKELIDEVNTKSKRKMKSASKKDTAKAMSFYQKRHMTTTILQQSTITGFEDMMQLQVEDRRVQLMLQGADEDEDEELALTHEQMEGDAAT